MIPRKRPYHLGDRIVGIVCTLALVFWIGFESGRSAATHAPKTCAEIPGLKPVSSTADTCDYIMAPRGVAYWRFKAI